MRDSEWLKTLKAGDKVCIPCQGMNRRNYTMVKVIRVTPGGRIVVMNEYNQESTFDKHGRRIGASAWNSQWLEEITPEIKDEIKRGKLLRIMKDYDFKDLSTSNLEKVYQLLVGMPSERAKDPNG
jgi:hypothetical protein